MQAFGDRLAKVRVALESSGLGGLAVVAGPDLRWLTGFTGTSGAAWVSAEAIVFATDARYRARVEQDLPDWALVDSRAPLQAVLEHASARERSGPIGIAGSLSWRAVRELTAVTSIPLVDDQDLIAGLRVVKDADEIAALRTACALTDDAVQAVHRALRPGLTEREAAWLFERRIREQGADGVAFAPIVAFGESSAAPHHAPTDRPLAVGDLVLTDVGAQVSGYCADMTRTVAFGPPHPRLAELHAVVVAAQAAGRAAVRGGVLARTVDAAARDILADAGVADLFVHGTGHGVGLEIHEAPPISATSTAILEAASTVTVEPGVYLPGLGGIRIEDLLLVGESEADSLTQLPRDLIVL